MYQINVERLQQLYLEARAAAEYAKDNYNFLSAKEHAYTLYGPSAARLGASIPSSFTPIGARKLLKTTRRKDYIIYELDNEYRPLRTIHMHDYTKTDCIYHHFDLNGVTYAYPFRGIGNEMYNDEISVLKFSDERPIYYASVASKMLFAQFYEYTDFDRMVVSTYRYWPTAKYTQYGYPVDWHAPIGDPNSPVQRYCAEEATQYIPFSYWFRKNTI